METTFYIVLSMKTGAAIESFGKFDIGNNRDHAYKIFKTLRGSSEADEKNVLFLELMETKIILPMNIKIISCTLGNELTENCRLITKKSLNPKLFKLGHLSDLL